MEIPKAKSGGRCLLRRARAFVDSFADPAGARRLDPAPGGLYFRSGKRDTRTWKTKAAVPISTQASRSPAVPPVRCIAAVCPTSPTCPKVDSQPGHDSREGGILSDSEGCIRSRSTLHPVSPSKPWFQCECAGSVVATGRERAIMILVVRSVDHQASEPFGESCDVFPSGHGRLPSAFPSDDPQPEQVAGSLRLLLNR